MAARPWFGELAAVASLALLAGCSRPAPSGPATASAGGDARPAQAASRTAVDAVPPVPPPAGK